MDYKLNEVHFILMEMLAMFNIICYILLYHYFLLVFFSLPQFYNCWLNWTFGRVKKC